MNAPETSAALDRDGTRYTVTVSPTGYALGGFAVEASIDFGSGVWPLGERELFNTLHAARVVAARRLLIYSQTPEFTQFR